ncbi:MAG: potassium channel family protein [Longimicrobiales bacterium]
MKFLPAQFTYFVQGSGARNNLRLLGRFLALLLVMVTLYSVLFHALMELEGQEHSWITGLYWTLTVMSTLGFGDITFQSDVGRVFSLIVLVSGVLFLLIVLPFTFIQFFYAPWLEAQTRRRVPREVEPTTTGHVLLASYDPVAISLVHRLEALGRPYFVIEPDLGRALELDDLDVSVVLGQRDDLDTYRALGVERAAMIVANIDDFTNTNIAFTVRELDGRVPIVSFARDADSVDVLELAGASHVIRLTEMLGRSLARRTLGGESRANIVARFDELVIAETPVAGTPLVGARLSEGWLRRTTGLTVVGAWERGRFEMPGPETEIHPSTVLLLAGSEDQLARFDELTAIYTVAEDPVLILGGGRVGRAAAKALRERDIDYRIVEQNPERVHDREHTVVGNAADLACLQTAGIRGSAATIVTTSDDATNIYLTIYCRRLRPDMQIISRATLERNVSTLHRAGADFVMSYASMGANAILNLLERGDVVMVAEGLDVFRVPVPATLRGVRLADTGIRERTGCQLVAWQTDAGATMNPASDARLPALNAAELILVGTTESERRFRSTFS